MGHTKEFTRPDFIPKGSDKLGLGRFKVPPLVDCRIVENKLYLDMEKAFNSHDELLKALESIVTTLERGCDNAKDKAEMITALSRVGVYKAIKNAKS